MTAPVTCSTPDRGYMGDPRGASLGRSNRDRESTIRRLRDEIESAVRRAENYRDDSQLFLFDYDRARRDECIARLEVDLERDRAELARLEAATEPPRFHLRRVRLDSGGYDPGGAYWGTGGTLFEASTADSSDFLTLRIYPRDATAAFKRHGGRRIGEPGYRRTDWTRQAAKDAVREEYPDARFYR
jgi:hypothetical protein